MKRILLAGIAIAALAGIIGSATAADLPRQAPMYKAPAYVAPMFNWTGAYIGLNAGGGWGKSSWSGTGDKFDVSGGMIGATVGYNWQFGTWVLGLEGDIDWTNIKGSNAFAETKNEYLSTIRGRVGYSFDRWMPYVTGGLALGGVKATDVLGNSRDETKAGWTVGTGVEFAFAPQWTAKVEYLYVDLGNVEFAGNKTDFYTNVVRGGVNYRF
ncbi:porin family protein [Xanthobacteraceae bacterium Astr-EGSB]|uniref:outer membrane protein n=1 Tax=Astrobacterium formosum TaxID=3069710 RepID=UPI0027AF4FF9|nr:porin family protein [Xanthobacteraceae bacterium Astr-EGSB]